MSPSIVGTRKRRGRPKTGIGPHVGLRLYPELEARLDAWILKQDSKPSRPEAIRQLLAAIFSILDKDPGEPKKKR